MAKIAIILNSSWNIYNFRLPLLNHLAEAGHEIHVIAPEDEYSEKIPFPFHHIHIVSRSTNPFADIKIFFDFFFLFRRLKLDILLLYTIKPNIYANMAAFCCGIKTISNIAGLGYLFINKGVATKIAKILYKIALLVPSKVFFQNNDDMSSFIKGGLVSEKKALRIPGSGIDLDRFDINKVNNVTAGEKDTFTFLIVCRMLWDKGVAEYIEAANKILDKQENVLFQLLGFLDADNPKAISKTEMNEITKRDGVEYLGVSDSVEQLIVAADCIVLPSYREGVPRSLLEAAALQKPLITTDVPGCRDAVENNVNGFLCKPKDSADLQRVMEKMLGLKEEERIRLGMSGRRKMENEFDQEIVFQHYLNSIAKIDC